jgi:hypothetical protein
MAPGTDGSAFVANVRIRLTLHLRIVIISLSKSRAAPPWDERGYDALM